jgi:hypothetical protein
MRRIGRRGRFSSKLDAFALHFRHLTDMMLVARAS